MVEYWEETIQLLQPANGSQLVTKPQLKPELLQKVPFKFLHDVITAILKKTNFANDLYSEDQLNRKWDGFDKEKVGKEANQNRRNFLSDIVNVVSVSLDEEIQCDVKEVLRGKDAAGANRLLQNLAKASHILQLDGLEAVQSLRTKEVGHADAEAQRPESRRAPKPSRAAGSDLADKAPTGKSQPATNAMPPVQVKSSEALESKVSESMDTRLTADVGRQRAHPQGGCFEADPGVDSHKVSTTASTPTAGTTQQALESLPSDVPQTATEAVPNTAAVAHTRPLTAKKAPPLASTPAQAKQRSRIQPPQELTASAGKRQGVHVFREESAPDEEFVDVVERLQPAQSSQPNLLHGVLVSEMYKAKNTADVALASQHDEGQTSLDGINLGRSKRSKHRTGLQADLTVIQQAVEKVVQQLTPLSRTMEYLQEDKENMQKELQIWRSEASKWGEQLAKEFQAFNLLDNTPLTTLDEQIERHKLSIKQLQRHILANGMKITGMVDLVIGDV